MLTKDGLPRKAFAYAPTAEPSTWKLPFLTAEGAPDTARVKAAAAALGEAGIPASFIPAVRAKLRSAYRRALGSEAQLPDGIAERELRRADGSILLREATVLLDKSATYATVVFAPNGDALIIPSWDGAFHYAQQPWVAPEPATPAQSDAEYESMTSKWNAVDATNVLKDLLLLKGNEADEPADAALIDKAIGAVTDFIRNENDQIVAECDDCSHPVGCVCTDCPCVNAVHVSVTAESAIAAAGYLGQMHEAIPQALLLEVGKRNSSKDASRIQAAHDVLHELGAVHTKGKAYAGMSESSDPSSSSDDSLVTAMVEVSSGAPAETIRFRESSYDEAAVVTLAEADPQFDPATRSVWITPIRPGPGNSRDKFYYPAGTLQEATQAGLFNGLKMFKNHPTKNDETQRPERDIRDWFASTKESAWDAARQRPRVRIQVHEAGDFARFQDAPEQIAFSILGGGMAKPGKVDGKDYRVVESFHNVNSVDWVTEAGAGGAIEFAESATEEFDMDLKLITREQLAEGNPELYEALTGSKPDAKPDATPDAKPADAAPAAAAEATAPTEMPAWFAPFAETLTSIQTRESQRDASVRLAETKAHATDVVKAALAESTLIAKAKDAVAAKFVDATIGEGGTHADDDALKAAVNQEAIGTQAMLRSIFGDKPSPVAGAAGAAGPDGSEKTGKLSEASAAFATELAESWGAPVMPPKRKLVFAPGEQMIDFGQGIVGGPGGGGVIDARESGAGEGSGGESKVSEAAAAVQAELARDLGGNFN